MHKTKKNGNTADFLRESGAAVVTNFKEAKTQVTALCFHRLQNNLLSVSGYNSTPKTFSVSNFIFLECILKLFNFHPNSPA